MEDATAGPESNCEPGGNQPAGRGPAASKLPRTEEQEEPQAMVRVQTAALIPSGDAWREQGERQPADRRGSMTKARTRAFG